MALVPESWVNEWYEDETNWVYKNFRYQFKNPMWDKPIPKQVSLCPYFQSALWSGFIVLRCFVVPMFYIAVGLAKITKLIFGRFNDVMSDKVSKHIPTSAIATAITEAKSWLGIIAGVCILIALAASGIFGLIHAFQSEPEQTSYIFYGVLSILGVGITSLKYEGNYKNTVVAGVALLFISVALQYFGMFAKGVSSWEGSWLQGALHQLGSLLATAIPVAIGAGIVLFFVGKVLERRANNYADTQVSPLRVRTYLFTTLWAAVTGQLLDGISEHVNRKVARRVDKSDKKHVGGYVDSVVKDIYEDILNVHMPLPKKLTEMTNRQFTAFQKELTGFCPGMSRLKHIVLFIDGVESGGKFGTVMTGLTEHYDAHRNKAFKQSYITRAIDIDSYARGCTVHITRINNKQLKEDAIERKNAKASSRKAAFIASVEKGLMGIGERITKVFMVVIGRPIKFCVVFFKHTRKLAKAKKQGICPMRKLKDGGS